MARNWSLYQTAIFDAVENGTGSIIIEAVAGSGKSSTIEEASRRIGVPHIMLAFNKAIAEELKARGSDARTTFTPEEGRPGRDSLVTVISHALWHAVVESCSTW